MNSAIKYRLYPTSEQKIMFAKTFGCCRKVYNLMLSEKIESYKTTGKFVAVTPAKYKKDFPYLKEVDSLALANVQLNLQSAFRNHFDRNRRKKTGFPKFKSARHSRKSYTTNNQNGTVAIIDSRYIRLPKIGKVRAVIHRVPGTDWKLRSATVSCSSDDRYYVSVLFEYGNSASAYVADENNAIGMDYASDGLYVDDKGNIGTNHKFYRESHKKLAKKQRILSRKKGSRKGEDQSHNYLKQQRKVNRIHTHIANQRKDNLHKISAEIANQYDIVCVENLNMRNMSNRGFGNGKATLDNGYGMFLDMLEYKLDNRGKHLVKVDRWYPSSQICHCCGKRHPEMKDLRIRTMRCECGYVMDRDRNAAMNIKKEGLRIMNSTA